ncbi:MAG TPA: ATP-binding protein [Burkholderiales bacterium]|nr:ATP-binding protein [Burkholderiales bacterium]
MMSISELLERPSRLGRHEADEIDAQVRLQQVRLLYSQLPTSTGGTMVGALLLAAVMWDIAPTNAITGWFACMAANQGWRYWLYLRWRRTGIELADIDRAANYWALGSLLSGCLWGLATLLFFVPDSPVYQAFLFVLIFAVTSAAVLLIGVHLPSFYVFVLPALVPIVVRNVIEGEPAHMTLAFIVGVATIALLTFGRNYNRVLVASLRNRFENEALARKLATQNIELERAKEAAERARTDAEIANRSKTQFFAAAGHDLRQPLHAMGLFAAALTEKARDPEVLQVVNSINASVDALEGLFNELLDISKIDSGVLKANPTHFELAAMLDRLHMDFEPEAFERGLSLRIVPTTAYLFSDPVLVERILRNLVSNALRYTRTGGVLVGARRRGREMSIEVWDTGIGIPPEQQDRVFEEFYQLANPERNSKKGLGLGLSIVKRLVNLLGAHIDLRSIPGRGSVFKVRLPLGVRPTVDHTKKKKAATAPGDLSGRVIVVVEDEAAVLEGMRVLLEGWGAEVVAGASIRETMAEVEPLARAPDLIVADYGLRDGNVGTQAITALRERFKSQIPAIIVSGSTTPTHVDEAKAIDAHLLLKPVMPAKLRTLIHFKLHQAVGQG